jgi:polyhydroxyalkanoate synthesis repressor PhaR
MSEDTVRTIKKYPNRRIYDTQDSKYITVSDVRDMVVAGTEFKIIDAKTKKDITRSVLLQIIIEQESETNPLFSTDNLQNFIRYYGENQQHGFSDFINQSLSFFQNQQDQFSSSMSEMMENNPVKAWSEISKQNVEMWQQMQGAIFGQGSEEPDKNDKKK